jgi:hypothetical protein
MGMVLGAAFAAIAFTVLHHRIFAQYALAMGAGTGFISHGQTPFSWSSRRSGRHTLSSDYRQAIRVQRH